MSLFNRRSKKSPEEINVSEIRFVGDQDGPPERELKSRLVEYFQGKESIRAGYLARVSYGDPLGVALCLRAKSGPDPRVAEEVGNIFSSMFGAHEHLDIVFWSETQEEEVMKVCGSFFTR